MTDQYSQGFQNGFAAGHERGYSESVDAYIAKHKAESLLAVREAKCASYTNGFNKEARELISLFIAEPSLKLNRDQGDLMRKILAELTDG